MDVVLTFLEGVCTFVSPCLLPLLPLYVAYFASAGEGTRVGTRRTLMAAVGFVVGFSALFIVLGALSGTLGSLLARHARLVEVASGVVLIVLGLAYAGVIDLALPTGPALRAKAPKGFASAVVFGVVFALTWTPCVGTFLASALALAATSGSIVRGVMLLGAYSAGLAVPFLLSALLIDELKGALGWLKTHHVLVSRVSGGLLVLVGVLQVSGLLGVWLGLFS